MVESGVKHHNHNHSSTLPCLDMADVLT